MTKIEAKKQIEEKLHKFFATSIKNATTEQVYKAVAMSVRDALLKKKQDFNQKVRSEHKKRVYYLCMEFLLGRNLKNNLFNMQAEDAFRAALKDMKVDINDLYEYEADPGLGNGGLGRLAACYMDALATLDYSAVGFSLKYEFGLFKQKLVDNTQVELPDIWLDSGEVWMLPRSDKTFKVKFGGRVVEHWENGSLKVDHIDATVIEASPYDLMISGYNSEAVSVLRLWKARSAAAFDMKSFSAGDYYNAMKLEAEAEVICKVLYPTDDHYAGKQLRLNQQYFLVSASIQNIFKDHLKVYPSLDNLPEKAAIHINDTHPALCVPEMMRILLDEYGYSWEQAWHITTNSIAYTNHTVLAEALEKWSVELIMGRLPRIYMIIKEIDRRYAEWAARILDGDSLQKTLIINHEKVHMANLSVIGSHSVNGVSSLHSDIIKENIFAPFTVLYKDKFTNVTNGIAHRRWLNQSNPRLASLISSLIGDGYIKNADQLKKLNAYLDDNSVLSELEKIKLENKKRFSDYFNKNYGMHINPNARFDVQIKRLHEYKRQLLNALKIMDSFITLRENPDIDMTPQLFIFGAKAAPGYYHAKRVISLICNLAAEIQKHPRIKEKLDVLFIENYNVSRAELLIPASEVSQQISLAGKEASGTSNMKFMMNGAITLGTLDGANVEISESVGQDNCFIFGLKTNEVDSLLHKGYYASYYYSKNPRIRRVIEMMRGHINGASFQDVASYLVGTSGLADPYMCQADFSDYLNAHEAMDARYHDRRAWNRMSLKNIAESGRFAADRAISEYTNRIWHLERM